MQVSTLRAFRPRSRNTWAKSRAAASTTRLAQSLAALIGLLCLAGVQKALAQTTPTTPKTIVPVQFNGTNGDITIGATTYSGNGGNTIHIVAISRQPDYSQPDAPELIWSKNYTNPNAVNTDLTP